MNCRPAHVLTSRPAKAIDTGVVKRPGATLEPALVLGDFNSDVARYPEGATTRLVWQGYKDSAAAQKTTGLNYATANTQYWQQDGGYPVKPYNYAYSPTRIDHNLQ